MAATASPRNRLQHILFHIRGVEDTLRGSEFETYKDSYQMQRTVERAVQIISEAVKALPKDMLTDYPEIEWPKIIAIGNLLRHEYQYIEPETLWEIAIERLPELKRVVLRILEDLPKE